MAEHLARQKIRDRCNHADLFLKLLFRSFVRDLDGLGDEYEVVVQKDGDTDRIKLRVEVLPEAENQCQLIEAELVDQLRLKTNLRYDIEICGCETLPRYEVKAKRFKDLRKKE